MDYEASTVPDTLKEYCAASTMRMMLFELSEKDHITYEQALLKFAVSPIYETLFDFETAVWKEGPVYLMSLYEDYLSRSQEQPKKIS